MIREEWELTGQPNNPDPMWNFPPYRFVFGNPADAAIHRDDDTTPEQRARDFIAAAGVQENWTDVRLRRRVIVESRWEDVAL